MLHDPAGRVTETHHLAADRALAQDSAHEPHHVVAIDKYPPEVVALQSAVIDEELSPMLLGQVRVLKLEEEPIDTLEIGAPGFANDQHSPPDHTTASARHAPMNVRGSEAKRASA